MAGLHEKRLKKTDEFDDDFFMQRGDMSSAESSTPARMEQPIAVVKCHILCNCPGILPHSESKTTKNAKTPRHKA